MERGEEEYANIVQSYGIPVVFYEPPELEWVGHHKMCSEQINVAWQTIINAASGYDDVLSLEIDVIPPVGHDILATMRKNRGDEHFLCHGVPWRESYNRKGNLAYELGCTLATVEWWQHALDRPGRLYNTIKEFERKELIAVALAHLEDDKLRLHEDSELGGSDVCTEKQNILLPC
jgi:hypothetical protein